MPGVAENPYSAMLGMLRADGKQAAWARGSIQSVSPLRVLYEGIVLEPEQLLVPRGTTASLSPGDAAAIFPSANGSMFLVFPLEGGAP